MENDFERFGEIREAGHIASHMDVVQKPSFTNFSRMSTLNIPSFKNEEN